MKMYGFILNMWVMRRYTEETVLACIERGYITQEEANMILATPQMDPNVQSAEI